MTEIYAEKQKTVNYSSST